MKSSAEKQQAMSKSQHLGVRSRVAASLQEKRHATNKRDGQNKPGHDVEGMSRGSVTPDRKSAALHGWPGQAGP